jgi:hypothetical protein
MPRVVLCAGLKSSGSTWLYNVVIQIGGNSYRSDNRDRSRRRMLPFYADRIEDFPRAAESADLLVVKTHIPSPSLAFLSRFLGGTVLITVREPRDSIASLMQRFGHDFEAALDEVGRSAIRLVELCSVGRPLIFRYEDGFFRRPATVARLGRKMDFARPLQPAAVDRIHNSLTAENVRRKIATLAKKGVFGLSSHPDKFDGRTHWHPGHIGDQRIGKYGEILSSEMQRQVLRVTADYCIRFGYPHDVPSVPE